MSGARAEGVRLVLAGVNLRVIQLLEMTKVADGFLPRVDTVEEADRSRKGTVGSVG